MKPIKFTFHFLIIVSILLCPIILIKSEADNLKEEGIIKIIDIINSIIKSPKEANVKNWVAISNPHDETEWKFFINSISDGTMGMYVRESDTWKRLKKHSTLISEEETSVVLQNLRLNLLSFNKRPGKSASQFKITNYSKKESDVIVKCNYIVTNSSGKTVELTAEITMSVSVTEENDKTYYLRKIEVEDTVVFGWWY